MVILRNPNTDNIQKAIVENNGYCCCRIDKTPEYLCICKEFREQEKPGDCFCGLYRKEFTGGNENV